MAHLKTATALVTILCISSLLFILPSITYVGRAASRAYALPSGSTIYVTSGQSIQEAVNVADPGDTIFVYNGTYQENIVVNKPLSIAGEGADVTFIYGFQNTSVVSIILSDNVTFSGFTVRGSGTGSQDSAINVSLSDNVVISGNRLFENSNGVSFRSSNNGVISGNTIDSGGNSGVFLQASVNNVISDNIISNNVFGVYLTSSGSNDIHDNMIFGNFNDGVSLISDSINNDISGNDLFWNNRGIFVSSYLNTIHHNNFNNTVQADVSPLNFWESDGEGNFWSDYNGTDSNGDGIGDTPYIPRLGSGRDNHPLMGMFSHFTIVSKEVAYRVGIISNSTIPRMDFETGTETGNKILTYSATGTNGTVGFTRITIPISLMGYPYIVLADGRELRTTQLSISNETFTRLYFTYVHDSETIRVISSTSLSLYYALQADFMNLNATYYQLLGNYTVLLANLTELQINVAELLSSQQLLQSMNSSYQQLLSDMLDLQLDFNLMNSTYSNLLRDYTQLMGNYSQLLINYNALTSTHQEQGQNIQSLMYVIVSITAIYIATTAYLSQRSHGRSMKTARVFEEQR